jgi:hypothetical protein
MSKLLRQRSALPNAASMYASKRCLNVGVVFPILKLVNTPGGAKMLGADKFGPYGLAAILAAALSACASTVSNFDALEIAGTYDTILTKQVVFNIYKTLQNQYGVPAFVKISTQTNQVT